VPIFFFLSLFRTQWKFAADTGNEGLKPQKNSTNLCIRAFISTQDELIVVGYDDFKID
jgi:hypothetical protein